MFIGHLAAGYIATSLSIGQLQIPSQSRRFYLTIGLVSSVLPDVDIIQFYLIDQQQYHHHSYITHMPLFWIALLTGWALIGAATRKKAITEIALIAGVNIVLHLALDSLVGSIPWLAPFSMEAFTLVEVTDRYDPWYLNFILHWTFVLEITIIVLALVLYSHHRTRQRAAE